MDSTTRAGLGLLLLAVATYGGAQKTFCIGRKYSIEWTLANISHPVGVFDGDGKEMFSFGQNCSNHVFFPFSRTLNLTCSVVDKTVIKITFAMTVFKNSSGNITCKLSGTETDVLNCGEALIVKDVLPLKNKCEFDKGSRKLLCRGASNGCVLQLLNEQKEILDRSGCRLLEHVFQEGESGHFTVRVAEEGACYEPFEFDIEPGDIEPAGPSCSDGCVAGSVIGVILYLVLAGLFVYFCRKNICSQKNGAETPPKNGGKEVADVEKGRAKGDHGNAQDADIPLIARARRQSREVSSIEEDSASRRSSASQTEHEEEKGIHKTQLHQATTSNASGKHCLVVNGADVPTSRTPSRNQS